jgi:hypothetical protein
VVPLPSILFSLVLGQHVFNLIQGIDFKMILMYPAWRAGPIYLFSPRISALDARNAILYNCFGRISHTSQWQWHPEGASESSTIIARLLYLQEALRSSILG